MILEELEVLAEDILAFALEQFGEQIGFPRIEDVQLEPTDCGFKIEQGIQIEPTDYGFLLKVRNKRKTYDKHGYKVNVDEQGVSYAPVRFTAWTMQVPLSVLSLEQIEALKQKSEDEGKEIDLAFITTAQEAILLDWQEKLRWVWNGGLGLLKDFTRYQAYDNHKPKADKLLALKAEAEAKGEELDLRYASKSYYPCCPLSLVMAGQRTPINEKSYQWYKAPLIVRGQPVLDEDGKPVEEFYAQLSCPIVTTRRKARRYKFRPFCLWTAEIPSDPDYVWYPPEVKWEKGTVALQGLSDQDLAKVFAQSANPDKEWLKDVPAQAVRAVLKDLAEAWGKYFWKKGGGEPRFKSSRKGDKVNSFAFEDAKCIAKAWRNGKLISIKLPKLGEIFIPKDYQDLWKNLPIATVKLVWDCGWILQLSTTQKEAIALRPNSIEATLEMVGREGVLFVDDKGKEYKISLEQQLEIEKEIKVLQVALQYQRDRVRLLEKQGRPSVRLQKQAEATQKRIKQLHRKSRLSGKAENQKLTKFALRRAGKITVLDKPHGMLLKPEPIPGKTLDSWEPNGASEIARINNFRKIHRVGQFVSLLEQKGKELAREVVIDKEALKEKKAKKTKKTSKKQLTKEAKTS